MAVLVVSGLFVCIHLSLWSLVLGYQGQDETLFSPSMQLQTRKRHPSQIERKAALKLNDEEFRNATSRQGTFQYAGKATGQGIIFSFYRVPNV
ncbi:hypothetical protein BofuT4_uP099780.1 [Botrytis cinerea T4]|uniref:Uncharacterized protein n=1 Tax=Botryotinia fuckeliana (strain T4) TaxID=999810 RepID=G2YC27_BOTF4|nr:hypothetical protein BofuT4_uP099780.1 [Botrytis cinerea T4]